MLPTKTGSRRVGRNTRSSMKRLGSGERAGGASVAYWGRPSLRLHVSPISAPSATGERSRQLRFGLSFLAIASGLFLVYCFPYSEGDIGKAFFDAYLNTYARIAGGVLALFARQVHVERQ